MIAHAHTVTEPDDHGARADVVLGRRCPGLSRHVARRLALAGALWIDGRRAPPSQRVALGQRLELRVAPPIADAPPPLVVLALTDAVVYVDKPAGAATHRLAPGEPLALADQVAARFPECQRAGRDPREAGALHRLDRPTSGVVAFARSRAAWEAGRAAFAAAAVAKRYAARAPAWPPPPHDRPGLVAFDPPWLAAADPLDLTPDLLADLARHGRAPLPSSSALRVSAPLGRGSSRADVCVRPDGLPARTVLQPLLDLPRGRALLLVDLHTGRRHQIRAHLAWLGLPLDGDRTYGGALAPRLALHAWRLDLAAALPGEPAVLAPLPADLLDVPDPG